MLLAPVPGLILRSLAVATTLAVLSACADTPNTSAPLASAPAQPAAQASPAQPPVAPEVLPKETFEQWRARFRQEALAAGIRATIFDQAFQGVEPDPAVVTADQSQPEFTRPVWEYLEGAMSPYRVRKG